MKQHVNTLEENVDKMAFETKQERQAVKKSLQDFSTRIKKLEEGFSRLEYRVTKLEGGKASSMHLETANTGIKQNRSYVFVLLLLSLYTPSSVSLAVTRKPNSLEYCKAPNRDMHKFRFHLRPKSIDSVEF